MRLDADMKIGILPDPLVGAMLTPALLVGIDHLVMRANAGAARLLGARCDEDLRGLDILVHIRPSNRQRLTRLMLEGAPGAQLECIIETPCGAQRCHCTRIGTQKGAAFGVLLQIPTSMALAAENARLAQESEAQVLPTVAEGDQLWKSAIINANQAVWDHDFELDLHFLSDAWYQLRGLKSGDPVPKDTETWLTSFHPDDRPNIKKAWSLIDSGETDVINYQFRQRHTAGHWVWFLSVGKVVRRNTDGAPARMIGTDTDISQIKAAEAERRRLLDQLQVALQAADMQRWEIDVSGDELDWDERRLRVFDPQGKRTEIPLNVFRTLLHPDDQDHLIRYARTRIKQKQPLNCEFRVFGGIDTMRLMRARGRYLFDPDIGGRYHGVAVDFTRDYNRAEELERARAQMEHDSRHDALTGLANRRLLDDVFSELCLEHERAPTKVAVLHIDIDHFKDINDTLGHDAGDAVLRHAAEVLDANTPDDALVARIGGDEFLALFPDTSGKPELTEIAEAIISAMGKPFYYQSHQCNYGTSIGIAICSDRDMLTSNLMIDADLALYAAKKEGRGRHRFFDSAMRREATARKSAFDNLLRGYENGEITCHFQPQYHTQTLALTGFEALVRWERPGQRLIMPDAFLGTAEEMGLLARIDQRVLELAVGQLHAWDEAGFRVPKLSVNVSAHRLNDPNLGSQLDAMNLPTDRIAFELLESAFLDAQNDIVRANLAHIADLGIDVEIDDFGSGHASIVSLLETGPSRLKIDRSLVQPIDKSRRQRALVKTIIEIGRMLEVAVVAEGVETTKHIAVLRSLGCHYLQGYGLSPPLTVEAASQLLSSLSQNGGALTLPR